MKKLEATQKYRGCFFQSRARGDKLLRASAKP
jgi:hypothetical protein